MLCSLGAVVTVGRVQVTMKELSMEKPSLQQALSSGGLSTRKDVLRLIFTDPAFVVGTFGFAIVPLILQVWISDWERGIRHSTCAALNVYMPRVMCKVLKDITMTATLYAVPTNCTTTGRRSGNEWCSAAHSGLFIQQHR